LKKIIILFLLLLYTGVLMAQKPAVKTVPAAAQPVTLKNVSDSIQYVLGAYVGQWMFASGFTISNSSLFLKGMDDLLKNNSQRPIPDSLIVPLITAYQQYGQKERGARQEQDLFRSLFGKAGIGMLPNGVRYLVLKPGKGAHPSETDSISLHLNAKLPDGTIVEDTYQSQKPFAATISSFFPGLNDALPMMSLGAKWQLFVPAALAYGEKGTAAIPPYSALVLEVELLAITPIKK
jgi:FKBP-type peptidyl-prolyl cis-trans isomerase FklB